MAEIIFTGDTGATIYGCTPFSEGLDWLRTLNIIGLDTETNVVESILNRQLMVIAIADESGDKIWVIDWESLNPLDAIELMREIPQKLCIIQNTSFD